MKIWKKEVFKEDHFLVITIKMLFKQMKNNKMNLEAFLFKRILCILIQLFVL